MIAPTTQEFYELKQSVESLIDAGQITNQRQLRSFLEQQDIDFDEFMEVDKDYEKLKSLGLTRETPFASPAAIVGATVGKLAEDVGDIALDVTEIAAGKKAREAVEGAASDVGEFLGDVTPEPVKYAFKATFDPRRNAAEDVTAELLAFGVGFKGVDKAFKLVKPTTKIGKAGRTGAVAVAADVLTSNPDEQLANDLVQAIPESAQYLEKLVVDPDDSAAERRLKQLVESAALEGILFGAGKALGIEKLIPAAIRGSRRLFSRRAAQVENITEPVARTRTATTTNNRVEEVSPSEFRQAGKVRQVVGKINTKLGRMFTSTAGLPQPLFQSYIKKQQFVQASDALIKKEAKELEKVLKRTGVDKELVNRLLSGQRLSPQEISQIPQEVIDIVGRMYDKINANSVMIKDLLELPDDSRLGMVIDPATGGAYITRTFEFTTNPKWSKDVAKAIKHELKDTPHNADVISAVHRARVYISRNNPDLSPAQIDAILMDIIQRGKKSDSFDILGELIQNGTGGPSAKILAGKKDLDKPILDFLGEVKDPVRNFTETMTNQNKLIAKAQYLQDVKKFAEQNLGREVKLGGLIPGIPTEVATFLRKAEFSPTQDVRESLGDLATKELGAFGAGGEAVGLNKFVTTKEFSEMLDKGIDTFSVRSPRGQSWLNLFAKPTAVGQSMETVFDHTAHLLNISGMFQQLAMNGILLRPQKFAKEAYESAYAMYQRAAKNDEEALKFLQDLKSRGVIDSGLTTEAIKKNIDRFGEGVKNVEGVLTKAIKSPLRGTAAVYGGVDDFGKIVAFNAEYRAYKKAFPNLSDEEVFDMATEVVRNTMPSYTTAAPAVRALSRMPLGTYATFPAEMLRTTKNILYISGRDIAQGLKTGNYNQALIGIRRAAGIGTVLTGTSYLINEQNTQMGVGQNNQRAVNLAVPEYQRNTTKIYTQPFYEDPETGEVMTRFVDSGFIDSMQYIKGPVRRIIGAMLAGEEVTQREIDDAFPDAMRELFSPYYSKKFLTKEVLNLLQGVDEEGNELSFNDRLAGLRKVFTPGSIKAGQKLLNAQQSEMIRGEGRGQTPAGFPNRVGEYFLPSEQAGFFATGIRNNTMNFNKAVGYSLYQDQKIINETSKEFRDFLKQFPDKEITPEDMDLIFETYVDLQLEKREAAARMADKVDVFRNVDFYRKGKDGKMYSSKFGMEGVIQSATSKGKYKVNQQLLNSLVQGPNGQGIFIPDSLSDKEMLALIQEKNFPPEVIFQLKRLEAELRKLPLRKVEEDE